MKVNGFPSGFDPGQIILDIGSIKNPPTTEQSASFTITTYTVDGTPIETANSGITIQPTQANILRSASVSPAEIINGKVVTYTITLVSENVVPD